MGFVVAFSFLPVCILWSWTKFCLRALCPRWVSFASAGAFSVAIRTALAAMVISVCFQNRYPAPAHGGLVSVVTSQKPFLRRSDRLIT